MTLLQTTAKRTADLMGRQSWLVRHLRPAYETLLDCLSHGRGIPYEINGVSYRVDPYQRHRLAHVYDAPVAEFLRTRVKPGAVCLNVGANVGVYVLQFSHWSSPRGRVIAFEPNPGARNVLVKHLQFNGLNNRVTLVPAAIGETAGEAILYAASADGMSRLGAPNQLIADQVKEISVPIMTLDDYCADQKVRPDWLFMDIEGFEIAALAGGRRLIKDRGRNLGIVVEIHPELWASANANRARAESMLADLGRRAVPLTGQKDALAEYGLVYLEPISN
ncbi:MAG TPA: FkbM family methyltransferase [Blastocatellia bacterium]|nr:FkbM family methyltransferase [Blastocatellia bacterium]